MFALQGTESRLFQPAAWPKTYSMAFVALLSVTLIPALTVLAFLAIIDTNICKQSLARWSGR